MNENKISIHSHSGATQHELRLGMGLKEGILAKILNLGGPIHIFFGIVKFYICSKQNLNMKLFYPFLDLIVCKYKRLFMYLSTFVSLTHCRYKQGTFFSYFSPSEFVTFW